MTRLLAILAALLLLRVVAAWWGLRLLGNSDADLERLAWRDELAVETV